MRTSKSLTQIRNPNQKLLVHFLIFKYNIYYTNWTRKWRRDYTWIDHSTIQTGEVDPLPDEVIKSKLGNLKYIISKYTYQPEMEFKHTRRFIFS